MIVAAPGLQFRHFSMWLGILIGSFDAFVLLMRTLGDAHVMDSNTVIVINAVLAFLIVPAKLLQQTISATTAQKMAMVEEAAAMPVKAGNADVAVVAMVEAAKESGPKGDPGETRTLDQPN